MRTMCLRSTSPRRVFCGMAASFIALATLVVVLVSTTGCSAFNVPANQAEQQPTQHRPLVLTTFTVTADMAREVAGDRLEVRSITRPGAEIHDYEPTPSDIRDAAHADLIVQGGLGLERWFERFVADSPAQRIDISKGVEPIAIAGGEHGGEPNPHAWMSPANGVIYVENLIQAFSQLDPDHADEYRSRGEVYKQRITEVGQRLSNELAHLSPEERTLVTCEGAFSYLCRDAGLQEVYLWPVNAEGEGTPQQIAEVVARIRSTGVRRVFCESTVNPRPMEQVSEETGVSLSLDANDLLYVDSLSEEGGPVSSYLKLLSHDADVIVAGLSGNEG